MYVIYSFSIYNRGMFKFDNLLHCEINTVRSLVSRCFKTTGSDGFLVTVFTHLIISIKGLFSEYLFSSLFQLKAPFSRGLNIPIIS